MLYMCSIAFVSLKHLSAPTGGKISSPSRTPSTGASGIEIHGFSSRVADFRRDAHVDIFLWDMLYSPAKKSQVVLIYIYIL